MNNQIFFTFYNLAHKSIFFDKAIIFTAQYFPYIVILLAGIFLLFHHDILCFKKKSFNQVILSFQAKWKEIVLVFFSGVLAWCLAQVLKILIHTPRPFIAFQNVSSLIHETGYAFPSGHATFYMAIAIALYFSHKKIGYVFMFFALLIGIARIITGVHFPGDIVGGFLLGILTAYLVKFLYQKFQKFKSLKNPR